MCGIAGIIDSNRTSEPAELKRMTDCISHRGPDAEGFVFTDGRQVDLCGRFRLPGYNPACALGHRRLSIIDLEGGIQPLCNEDRTVWVTYNGEIYNHLEIRARLEDLGHRFSTDHSDTEVIVHAYEQWGVAGFDLFNGIFAFGLMDLKNRKVVLARDHFGVKPLYYSFQKGRLLFSSEIKAILACRQVDRELDRDALDAYLSFRYVPSPLTMFRDVFKIEAGGYLEFDLAANRIAACGTYTTETPVIDERKPFSRWVEEYRHHFQQAVKRQLLSDVEVGALLSGGVDSSAVCAVAVKHLGHPDQDLHGRLPGFPGGKRTGRSRRPLPGIWGPSTPMSSSTPPISSRCSMRWPGSWMNRPRHLRPFPSFF